MPTELPLTPGVLPAPFTCYQPLYNEMFALGAAQGPAITGLLIQDATPDAGDHDKGWIPTAGGVPRFPGYVFVWHAVLGHWVSRNAINASDASRRLYVGANTSIDTYDGGDGGAPGAASGPMWARDTLFDGRFPIGVGDIPGSSPLASIVSPLDTTDSLGASGEYKHVLTAPEVEGHFHGVGTDGQPGGGDPPIMISRPWSTAPTSYTERFEDTPGTDSWGDGGPISSGTMSTTDPIQGPVPSNGHNTMPPFIGVFVIKRTAREFYVAA